MLLEEFKIPEVIKKYLTGGNIGFDKDGSVVWYDPFGLMDMKGKLPQVYSMNKKLHIMWMSSLVMICAMIVHII